MRRRVETVRRANYCSADDYHRALREAGGPHPDEVDVPCGGSGPNSALFRAVYGHDFGATMLDEQRQEQARNPGRFRARYRGGRPRRRG